MFGPLVPVEWLRENLNDPGLVILDASQKDNKAGLTSEFENIQIAGTRYFDLENDFSDKNSDLPNMLPSPGAFEQASQKLGINSQSKIVVYDSLGVYSSPRVWWMFKTMGHDEVAVLDGGLPAWVQEGGKVEPRQEKTFERGDFKAKHNLAGVKDKDDMINNLHTKTAVVLDARSYGRFSGEAPEPREGLPSGHIPGSVNLPFKKVLDGHHYRSKGELQQLFSELDTGDKPLIFSCGSGLTACITLLASEMVMENPKSVYDGSWTEWALAGHLPMERKNL